ncbi:hypothetical protein KAK07_09685 [Ideonella sp. 4Y16]|uniref:Uncharacterized protein n=1 Tax=Ideonella alba TaxID=2824118 RepID=A0A940YDV1_9BURK|nr:hypothetical protein [Ideonella alba]MBQ0933306.1 hypothetical protein [Ideonella alba]MBQ0943606.1 hypothetical protein [Ideonella alba]
MHNLTWTQAEKSLSRRLFDQALDAELADTLAQFKARAAAVSSPEAMWAIQPFLADRQREIDAKYDYRYSQLIIVFGRLLREGRIQEAQLAGLSEDKQALIKHVGGL